MGSYFGKSILIALALGALSLAFDSYRKTDYVETTARVTSVKERCSMKLEKRGLFIDETRYDTKGGSCYHAEKAIKTDPAYRGYELVRRAVVEYQYVSPADGKTYWGKMRRAEHPDGRLIRRGDELVILAHKSSPQYSIDD